MESLGLKVVRRIGSSKTHVMTVNETIKGEVFGKEFDAPYPDGSLAACGVKITDGVIMRPGTKVRCSACTYITGVAVQA